MKILVTGCAGFIGSTLTDRLLLDGHNVVGIDNFNNYYDPARKESNIKNALGNNKFTIHRFDILDVEKLTGLFKSEKFDVVAHLAARAGVRPSIENPLLYASVNVQGTVNLLKASSNFDVSKFIFGSSSSVYGNSKNIPSEETDQCFDIVSPYGASKRSAEFFVESFYKNYGLKAAILRFFTVYGPKGRPDMAPALFTKAILEGTAFKKFGDGTSSRDYTYIDDIVEGIIRVIDGDFDFETINLGNSNPVSLDEFIKTLEELIGKKAIVENMPMQEGDVEKTWANVVKAKEFLDWEPKVKLNEGLKRYLEWLKNQS